MATLHVRNVPDELYERLRSRARARGRSINAETIALLGPSLSASAEREEPERALRRAGELRAAHQRSEGAPTVVEALRADRDR